MANVNLTNEARWKLGCLTSGNDKLSDVLELLIDEEIKRRKIVVPPYPNDSGNE